MKKTIMLRKDNDSEAFIQSDRSNHSVRLRIWDGQGSAFVIIRPEIADSLAYAIMEASNSARHRK